MIKINLAKKREGASGLSGFSIAQIREWIQSLTARKEIPLPDVQVGEDPSKAKFWKAFGKWAVCIGLLIGIDYWIGFEKNERLSKISTQLSALEIEKNQVQQRLLKVKGYETIKKQLEEDEKSIRTKVDVMAQLLTDRNIASKMLMHIAQAIPAEVWLTELKMDPKAVKVTGSTSGYNQVSDFIKNLTETADFNEISLSGIEESLSRTQDQRIQNFELSAARRMVEP